MKQAAEILNSAGSPDQLPDQPGVAPETKKNYKEIGAERRKAINENIAQKKSWIIGAKEKLKALFGSAKEDLVDYTLAAPDMVKDAAVEGYDTANKKIDAVVETIDNKVTDIRVATEQAAERAQQWAKEKAEIAEAIAVITGHLAAGAAISAKDHIETRIAESKESLKNNYQKAVERGNKLILDAQTKGKSAMDRFRTWRINRALERATQKEDLARAALVKAIQEKRQLTSNLFPLQTAA